MSRQKFVILLFIKIALFSIQIIIGLLLLHPVYNSNFSSIPMSCDGFGASRVNY